MIPVPKQLSPNSPQVPAVLALIRAAFASMEGRIDPPSSMHKLTVQNVRAHCTKGEVWNIGAPPRACVFLTPKSHALYLGKLAVAAQFRGQGLGRHLVDLAAARARALGLSVLELETRIELVENHATFERLGFVKTAKKAHPGFDRPTSITMQRRLDPSL